MALIGINIVFVFSIALPATFSGVECQIGIPQIIALLGSVNDTSTNMSAVLTHLESVLKSQEDLHILTNLLLENSTAAADEMVKILKHQITSNQNNVITLLRNNQQNDQEERNLLQGHQDSLSQIATGQSEVVALLQSQQDRDQETTRILSSHQDTLTQLAAGQSEVVNLLQRQEETRNETKNLLQSHHSLSQIATGQDEVVALLQSQQERDRDTTRILSSHQNELITVLQRQEESRNETKSLLHSHQDTLFEISDSQNQMVSLLQDQNDNQNETVTLLQSQQQTMASMAATQTQIATSLATLLQKQQDNQNKTVALLQNHKKTLTQIADTQSQMAQTQTQMANTFTELVNLLQMQSQQIQNMSDTMNTVVSVLETQQETLKKIATQGQQSQNTTAAANQVKSTLGSQVVELLEKQSYQLENVTINLNKQLDTQVLLLSQNTPRDCSHLAANGDHPTGPYEITVDGSQLLDAYCDMDTAGGGWTVFQRRYDGSVDFYRNWDDYEQGFGSLNGEFWLGLRKIHMLTLAGHWLLRVDLEDFQGNVSYAVYDSFQIGDAASNYTLRIGSYSGSAGDSLSFHNNLQFSTYDRDNDVWDTVNCADIYHGAWWFSGEQGWWMQLCGISNLKGQYLGPSGNYDSFTTFTEWWWIDRYGFGSLKKSEMKIRRVE